MIYFFLYIFYFRNCNFCRLSSFSIISISVSHLFYFLSLFFFVLSSLSIFISVWSPFFCPPYYCCCAAIRCFNFLCVNMRRNTSWLVGIWKISLILCVVCTVPFDFKNTTNRRKSCQCTICSTRVNTLITNEANQVFK